ncbi:MAG: hypothetical protein HY705_08020 [Gemmatimonadetes bacterium]|nr:hypothetical protein [Gemmatimonadota bacterium]
MEQSAALRHPPVSVAQLLHTLRAHGLVQSVARLRELFGPTSILENVSG